MPQETPLAGGNMGAVVRIGDRVHRAAGPQAATVHRLLAHVRSQGVTWVPRVHGFDVQGREVLDYIPGDVHHDTPEWMRADANLREVGARLREWHDATTTFERSADDVWWWQPGKQPQEVICHVDFAPYNHVYDGHRWVGAIDFDLAYPGPRVWDLAYTAYRYVPLTPHRADAVADGDGVDGYVADRSDAPHEEQRRRLAVLLDGYGQLTIGGEERVYSPAEVLARLPERLVAMADWCDDHIRTDLRRHGVMYRAHAAWIAGGGLLDTLEP
ncbi:phosphotransferase [Demequina sp. NBRC 110056]|uniref:phosphotransferase n=1 Tax=Demequina sp. NBRC 110056 TaxID=1570345 RepID=UPI000A02EB09|nr:phosphotransferase [Demequina sp. NBRC 110056]